MKKYNRQDQASLANWAADVAERVLPLFENTYPKDDRPRNAIETCRIWVRTGIFKMTEIRGASLGAHAAAREATVNKAAQFAARSAGQAVATAHVPQHAFGAAYYALRAVAAADPSRAESTVAKELEWQLQHISNKLAQEVSKRVTVHKVNNRIAIRITKDKSF
jgi:hypothetical protein